MLKFELPWPPTVNHYWGMRTGVKNKKVCMYVKPEGIAFRNEVYYLARQKNPLLGKLKIHIVAHPPDNRTRDLDNLLKATCDALEYSGVFENDFQLCYKSIERASVKKHGALLVEVGPLK